MIGGQGLLTRRERADLVAALVAALQRLNEVHVRAITVRMERPGHLAIVVGTQTVLGTAGPHETRVCGDDSVQGEPTILSARGGYPAKRAVTATRHAAGDQGCSLRAVPIRDLTWARRLRWRGCLPCQASGGRACVLNERLALSDYKGVTEKRA